MKAILDGYRDHLQQVHDYVDVGRKHPDTPPTSPWCALAVANSIPEENTQAAGDIDVSQESVVHLRCVGTSDTQLGLLLDALEAQMRTIPNIDGRVVHLVIHDRTQGPEPERDTSLDPDPAAYIAHSYWTVQHAPSS